jgi:hypothetical protein
MTLPARMRDKKAEIGPRRSAMRNIFADALFL